MKIRSLYFLDCDDVINSDWTREVCNSMVYEGNNVFSHSGEGWRIEYRFNEDFTSVNIITGSVGIKQRVQVTFED